MTKEEAKSCIGTIEMLQRLAYNIHGVMDVIDADNCNKIIKSLEQEPCENCISRQAVLEWLKDKDFIKTKNQEENARRELADLPSVTPQPRWIPCSERLPEEDGFYLATCDGEICGEDEPISSMAEFENGKWVDDEDDYQCVLAWMPLPQPYKVESEVQDADSD